MASNGTVLYMQIELLLFHMKLVLFNELGFGTTEHQKIKEEEGSQ